MSEERLYYIKEAVTEDKWLTYEEAHRYGCTRTKPQTLTFYDSEARPVSIRRDVDTDTLFDLRPEAEIPHDWVDDISDLDSPLYKKIGNITLYMGENPSVYVGYATSKNSTVATLVENTSHNGYIPIKDSQDSLYELYGITDHKCDNYYVQEGAVLVWYDSITHLYWDNRPNKKRWVSDPPQIETDDTSNPILPNPVPLDPIDCFSDLAEPVILCSLKSYRYYTAGKDWTSGKELEPIDFSQDFIVDEVYGDLLILNGSLYVIDENGVDFQSVHYNYADAIPADKFIAMVEPEGYDTFYKVQDLVIDLPYLVDSYSNEKYYWVESEGRYFNELDLESIGYYTSPIPPELFEFTNILLTCTLETYTLEEPSQSILPLGVQLLEYPPLIPDQPVQEYTYFCGDFSGNNIDIDSVDGGGSLIDRYSSSRNLIQLSGYESGSTIDRYNKSRSTFSLIGWNPGGMFELPSMPTITQTDDFGTNNLFKFSTNGSNYTFNNGVTTSIYRYDNGEYGTWDSTKSYAVILYRDYNNTFIGRVGVVPTNSSNKVYMNNQTGETIIVSYIRVAVCSDSSALVVTVYNSNNTPYNAFKYTRDNIDYYWVLDTVQNDWTDDLSSIGYSLTQATLPEVSFTGDAAANNWIIANSGSGGDLATNSSFDGYYWDGSAYQVSVYNSSYIYAVIEWRKQSPFNEFGGRVEVSLINNSGTIAMKNVSSDTISLSQCKLAACHDSSATVITVYDLNNDTYNAFKYILGVTEYYYVLDGVQSDWTDDLSSINYSLIPAVLHSVAYFNGNTPGINTSLFGSSSSTSQYNRLYEKIGSSTQEIPFNPSYTYNILKVYDANNTEIQPSGGRFELGDSTTNNVHYLRLLYFNGGSSWTAAYIHYDTSSTEMVAYFNSGNNNSTKTVNTGWGSTGDQHANLYPLNSSQYIPYDSTKAYKVNTVFYANGANPVTITNDYVTIDDKNYAGTSVGHLMIHTHVNNPATGNVCGCTYTVETPSFISDRFIDVTSEALALSPAPNYTPNGYFWIDNLSGRMPLSAYTTDTTQDYDYITWGYDDFSSSSVNQSEIPTIIWLNAEWQYAPGAEVIESLGLTSEVNNAPEGSVILRVINEISGNTLGGLTFGNITRVEFIKIFYSDMVAYNYFGDGNQSISVWETSFDYDTMLHEGLPEISFSSNGVTDTVTVPLSDCFLVKNNKVSYCAFKTLIQANTVHINGSLYDKPLVVEYGENTGVVVYEPTTYDL